jgi:hypothetical protein
MRLIILVFTTYCKHESIEEDEICRADGARAWVEDKYMEGFCKKKKKNYGKKERTLYT